MGIYHEFLLLFRITRSYSIMRRYFVVNGFDGALTMLGIIVGFYFGEGSDIDIILGACLGAAVALGMSGVSSAYISESAERQKELKELESAMGIDLSDSAHGRAARLVPVFIAVVNGAAPLCVALFIISPLWLTTLVASWPLELLQLSILFSFISIFFLGAFLGRVSGTFWLLSGLRTLMIGLLTCAIIYGLSP